MNLNEIIEEHERILAENREIMARNEREMAEFYERNRVAVEAATRPIQNLIDAWASELKRDCGV